MAIFLTHAEAMRLAGHPGRVDAIGVLAAPGFDAGRLRAAADGAQVLTGGARGAAKYPELELTRTTLIPVTAAFGGLAMFIAIFVVASTLGLSVQQREREIALLRAVAATPGQIRRMIAWEAAIIALAGSAAGIWPGIVLGRALAHGLMRHGTVPHHFILDYDSLPAAAAIVGGVTAALLAVLAAGRRAARVPPTLALTDAAAEPRLLGPGRVIGGLLTLAGAVPLFTVSATTTTPETAAATSELNAIFLVVAAAFLGPIVPYVVARLLADTRATPGVRSAIALTSTTLGPSLGADDHPSCHDPGRRQGGGLDAGVIAGSLSALHGDAIALVRHRADAAHARIGGRMAIMLGDGTRTRATVVAIYTRDLAFGDALLAPELAAGHHTTPLLRTILIRTGHPHRPGQLVSALARRYPGLHGAQRLFPGRDPRRRTNHGQPFFIRRPWPSRLYSPDLQPAIFPPPPLPPLPPPPRAGQPADARQDSGTDGQGGTALGADAGADLYDQPQHRHLPDDRGPPGSG